MEMPAFDQIFLFHVILLPVPDTIAAVVIIEAAAAAIIKVAAAVTIVYIIPREAILTTDVAKPLQMKILLTGLITIPVILMTLLLVMISTLISQKTLIPLM